MEKIFMFDINIYENHKNLKKTKQILNKKSKIF